MPIIFGRTMKGNFIHVVDNFYSDPDRTRQWALETPFIARGGDRQGWGTPAYQPVRIKAGIEKRFGVQIKYWEDRLIVPETENGSLFSAFSKGKRMDPLNIHYDRLGTGKYRRPDRWVVLIVYLTPDAPFGGGTSMWQHRKTGLTSGPLKKDTERLQAPIGELEEALARDAYKRQCWKEIDRVGNVYNRAVMFPSIAIHSATRHFGSNRLNGRLIQVFYFSI
jgi:hypothetical protein